jgi:hypothetical protein
MSVITTGISAPAKTLYILSVACEQLFFRFVHLTLLIGVLATADGLKFLAAYASISNK